MFYLAHRENNRGGLAISRATCELALAGAVIGELLLSGHLTVEERTELVVLADPTPPQDLLCHGVYDLVRAEVPAQPLEMWLRFCAGLAYDWVAERMVKANQLVEQVEKRTWPRKTVVRYLPTTENEPALPWVRLSTRLRNQEDFPAGDRVLAAVLRATELDHAVLQVGSDGIDVVKALNLQILGASPPVQALHRRVRALVGSVGSTKVI